MKKLLVFAISLLLTSSLIFAQDYEFRVMVNKGDVTMKKSGGDWASLRTGAKLNSNDAVKLAEESYLGLVHKTGKTLELKEAGTYTVKDLSSRVGNSGSNIASKYAEFVLSKMSPEEREENRRKYASVTGAVERATGDAAIKVMIPTSVEFYNPKAIVMWEGEEGNKYEVTIKNMFDEVILEESTDKNYYKVDFSQENLNDERLVIFNVSLAENADVKSGDYGLKRIALEDAQKFEGELEELKASLGEEESSLNRVILAEFYEQNNLLVDALTNYVKAMQLSPEVDYFKEVYEEFKMRNNLGK